MLEELVKNMTSRSIPIPQPAAERVEEAGVMSASRLKGTRKRDERRTRRKSVLETVSREEKDRGRFRASNISRNNNGSRSSTHALMNVSSSALF